jgi:L-rhamnose mutarotase
MKKKSIKILVAVMITAVMIFSAVSAGYAATGGYKKTLEAWYGLTNIRYNGQDLTAYAEPFAVNDIYGGGTTYLPLRKMCEIFKIDIDWDPATNTVIMNSTESAQIAALKSDIIAKDLLLAQKQDEINKLQEKLNFYESGGSGNPDLDDLEDALNDDYDTYRNIEFVIYLDGDEDEIEVEIEVDLDDYSREWNNLSTSRKERFLQDICDDILDEFKDADIDGVVIDSSRSRNNVLLSFYTDRRGNVVIDSSMDSKALEDLEKELDDEYYDYFDDEGIDEISIELEEKSNKITFTVNIDLYEYSREWNWLTNTEVRTLMNSIYNDILYEFKDAVIEGIVYDIDGRKEIAEFRKPSSGGVIFERY